MTIILYFVAIMLAAVGWLVGEIYGRQALRVASCLLMIGLIGLTTYALGSLLSSTNTSIATTDAVDRFIAAVVAKANADEEEAALDAVRAFSEGLSATYEVERFV